MHLQYCLGQPIAIRGESMEPTLRAGKIVWVNKLAVGLIAPPIVPSIQSSGFHRLASWGALEKSSIVVIRFPGLDDGADAILVKRVVALPGERFEFRDDHLFVNDEAVSVNGKPRLIPTQPVTIQPPVFRLHTEVEQLGPVAVWAAGNGLPLRGLVPAGGLIVLGDRANASRDSRSFGFVPIDYVMGTVKSPVDGILQ
ncbi:MAG: signal peptidase I [Leptospirales bacterium]|nr:signal peptidase I [Leptospirales bacterium]